MCTGTQSAIGTSRSDEDVVHGLKWGLFLGVAFGVCLAMGIYTLENCEDRVFNFKTENAQGVSVTATIYVRSSDHRVAYNQAVLGFDRVFEGLDATQATSFTNLSLAGKVSEQVAESKIIRSIEVQDFHVRSTSRSG